MYDRALSDKEVSESFAHWSGQISDLRVIEALSETDRAIVKRFKDEIEERKQSIDSLGLVPSEYSQRQGWVDLARTMFLLKEFIYVR